MLTYKRNKTSYRSADFSTGSGNFTESQVSAGEDEINADKFFISTIVRF